MCAGPVAEDQNGRGVHKIRLPVHTPKQLMIATRTKHAGAAIAKFFSVMLVPVLSNA
jgi:hypothetical protein